jgi:hypothetical protein
MPLHTICFLFWTLKLFFWSKELAEFQSPESHQSLEKLRSYHGDALEVGRFLLWFGALVDSSITKFSWRWINKNNRNIFLPTSCRFLSLSVSVESVLAAIYVSLPLKTVIFAFSSSPPRLSHLSLSPPLSLHLPNPQTLFPSQLPFSPLLLLLLVRQSVSNLK